MVFIRISEIALLLLVSLFGREVYGEAITLPLRVALQTCSIANSGSSSSAFRIAWAFPTTSAILSTPPSVRFQRSVPKINSWYAVLDASMTVDDSVFLNHIDSQITITAENSDALCIAKVTVNGVYVSGSLPIILDSPCSSTPDVYPCSLSFVGTFQLTPPLYPVTMQLTTCNLADAGSVDHFLLEFAQQNMAWVLVGIPSRGTTRSWTVYAASFLQSQTMSITAQQGDSWCLLAVTVDNIPTTFAGVWIDKPCGSGSSGFGCKVSVSIPFTATLPEKIVASIVSSPTYRAKIGTGFAAIDPVTGAITTWGSLTRISLLAGSEGVTHATTISSASALQVVAGRSAFAALLADGSITAWGATSVLVGSVFTVAAAVHTLVANDNAFAGITTAGAVFAFGSEFSGGNVVDNAKCNGYTTQLSAGITTIVASAAAFAAITDNGDVYAWGSQYTGGGISTLTRPELQDIVSVAATRTAFAALTSARSLVTWGDKMGGGDSSAVAHLLASEVLHVIGSQSVFVAFKFDGSLVVWGNSLHGGSFTAVAPLLAGVVRYVSFNAEAVVALKANGSMVAWGLPGSGGDVSIVSGLNNVLNIYSNKYAFAALTYGGGVVAWGEANEGGLVPSAHNQTLSSGVVSVFATDRAFAALKSDGAVVVWGNPHFGGDTGAAAPHLTSGVTDLCANDVAFTAMKSDGSAVVWGHSSSVPFAGILNSTMDFSGAKCA